jgi:mannose-1-phosphate guanylyltransferase
LLEPVGRNTAPAIALAAHAVRQLAGDDALMLVLPRTTCCRISSHSSPRSGSRSPAAPGKLVAFGIVARYSRDGYGYIRESRRRVARCRPIEQFVEKPTGRAPRVHRLGRLLLELGHVPVRRHAFPR